MNQPIGGAHQDEDGALDRLDVLGGQVKVHFGVLPAVHRIGAGGRLRDGGAQKAHGRRSAQDGGVQAPPDWLKHTNQVCAWCCYTKQSPEEEPKIGECEVCLHLRKCEGRVDGGV